jgi:hypothetical protein
MPWQQCREPSRDMYRGMYGDRGLCTPRLLRGVAPKGVIGAPTMSTFPRSRKRLIGRRGGRLGGRLGQELVLFIDQSARQQAERLSPVAMDGLAGAGEPAPIQAFCTDAA